MPTPGATRSGFAPKSIHVGPAELNFAMVSLLRLLVASSLDAPTVSTHGALPGDVMPPVCFCPSLFCPRLPADATTTMPLSTARWPAGVGGSSQYDSNTPAATDRLMTRMLYVPLTEIA